MKKFSQILILVCLSTAMNAFAIDLDLCTQELKSKLSPLQKCEHDEDCKIVWIGCPLCFDAVNGAEIKKVEEFRSQHAACIDTIRCKCLDEKRLSVKCESKKCVRRYN